MRFLRTNFIALVVLLVALTCVGQAHFRNATIRLGSSGQAATTPFNPTNLPGRYLFLSYHDLPTNGVAPAGWTNEMDSSVVYTNHGTTSNTPSGVLLPYANQSPPLNYFSTGSNVKCEISNYVSMWFSIVLLQYDGGGGSEYQWLFTSVDSAGAGTGIYCSQQDVIGFPSDPVNGVMFQNNTDGAYWYHQPTNVPTDIAIVITATNTVNIYTNGVLEPTNHWDATPFLTPFQSMTNLWGIGRSYGGFRNQANAYIRFVALYTNAPLSSIDVWNLHSWSVTN